MKQQPKRQRRLRGAGRQLRRSGGKRPREYGIGDFLAHIHGLTQAARKIQREEQLMLAFDPNGKPVN